MSNILDLQKDRVLIRVKVTERLVDGLLAVKSEDSNFDVGLLLFLMEMKELVPKGLHYQQLQFLHDHKAETTISNWGIGPVARNCSDQLYAEDSLPGSLCGIIMSETNPKLLMILSFLLIELRNIDVKGVDQHKIIIEAIIQRLDGFITEQRRRTRSYIA